MSLSSGRGWHLLTAVVTTAALVLQLWLVVDGAATLVDNQAPPTGTALVRFFSYFTVLSNILVAGTTWTLALGRERDATWWRVLRLDAVVGILVTGVVHWFLLRPLLHLTGASYVADKLLHVVVPVLAVVGWLVLGPRGRVRAGDVVLALAFPVLYLAWTLLHGAVSDWYPYPFISVTEHGYAQVLLTSAVLALAFVGLCLGARALDPRLDHVGAGRR